MRVLLGRGQVLLQQRAERKTALELVRQGYTMQDAVGEVRKGVVLGKKGGESFLEKMLKKK